MPPSLHLIPEVLLQIAPHLDTRSHLACLNVSHLWHTIFTPYFWESINDYQWPWRNLLRPLDSSRLTNNTPQRGVFNPGARRFQQLLDKYGQHVRRMVINYDSLLLIAFEARLTHLTELWIRGQFTTPLRHSRIRYDLKSLQERHEDDPTALRLTRVIDESLVPSSIFLSLPGTSDTYHLSVPHAIYFTQICWHLVLDNSSALRSLRFMRPSIQTLLRLAPPSVMKDYPYLREDSMRYLVQVLEGMEDRLEELQLGSMAEEFLLQFVGRPRGHGWGIGEGGSGVGRRERFLENVKSLHYSAVPGSALSTLLDPPVSSLNNNNDNSTDNNIPENGAVLTYNFNNFVVNSNYINTTVQKLTLHSSISLLCLRDLLIAFPNLQELCGGNHLEWYGSTEIKLDRVIVSNIKHLTGLTDLWRAFRYNFRMPLLKTMGSKVRFRDVEDLMHVLQECPELETLEVEELGGVDDRMAVTYVHLHTLRDLEHIGGRGGGGGAEESLYQHGVDCAPGSNGEGCGELITGTGMEWKIRELTIQHSQYRGVTIPQLLCRMPCLVRLELGSISRKAVEVIAGTCGGTLEGVKFYLREVCFEEMGVLLRKCGRLKSLRGLGLAVSAEDFGVDEGWGCLGVEELQIEIHDVPQLTSQQEQLLLRHENNNLSEDEDEEKRKEYKEALAEQNKCDSVRHRVLNQLSRLQELRLLDLSFQPLAYKRYQTRFCGGSSQRPKDRMPICDHPVPNSLSLSLSRPPPPLNDRSETTTVTGLEQLATLKKLETIGFKAVEHGVGKKEVQWMSESWPRMKTVLGASSVLYKGHGTGHQDCRCLDKDVLPVELRGLFEKWVKGVVFPPEEA